MFFPFLCTPKCLALCFANSIRSIKTEIIILPFPGSASNSVMFPLTEYLVEHLKM